MRKRGCERKSVFFQQRHKNPQSKHHLFPFTTLIIPTFYHFLTFQLQILKDRNNIDSIANLFIPLFSIYLSQEHLKKEKKKNNIYSRTQLNNKKLYAAGYRYRSKRRRSRDKEGYGWLQKPTRMISNCKKKKYKITYQKSPGGSHIDNPEVTYLQPFNLERPAFNLFFSSAVSSKYKDSLDANCSWMWVTSSCNARKADWRWQMAKSSVG